MITFSPFDVTHAFVCHIREGWVGTKHSAKPQGSSRAIHLVDGVEDIGHGQVFSFDHPREAVNQGFKPLIRFTPIKLLELLNQVQIDHDVTLNASPRFSVSWLNLGLAKGFRDGGWDKR